MLTVIKYWKSQVSEKTLNWSFERADRAFPRHRKMWDEINRSQNDHILLDSNFVEPLITHFGGADVLLGISHDFGGPAMALVNRTRLGMWQTFQPSQAPLGLILLSASTEGYKQVKGLIRALPGHALGMGVLQQDPDFSAFGATRQSYGVEFVESIET